MSSFLAVIGGINIFYAMYGLTQRDWVNILIPTVTFLVLIYSAAILDVSAMEKERSDEIEKSHTN